MKKIILMMCIVAYASIFSSCSTDDSPTVNANQLQTENSSSEQRPILPIKPTIHMGTITGTLNPVVPAYVIAKNSKETEYSGYMRESGLFKISPVPVGIYTVWVLPKNPALQAIRVPNVEVRHDQTTNVGLLSFSGEQQN